MAGSTAYGVYLGHSGFYLEFPSVSMVFDWYQGELPEIRDDKPLYFFISHVHADHFSTKVFEIAARHPQTEIFIGYDYSAPGVNRFLEGLPKKIQDMISCFDGGQRLFSEIGDVFVSTLHSTDLGVAFLVEVEGKIIFHAGDLFLMQTVSRSEYEAWRSERLLENANVRLESYEQFLARAENQFLDYTEPLRGKIIDYGMLPMDPRFGDVGVRTIERYMNVAGFRVWSPMHLWKKYDYVDYYIAAHSEDAGNMIGVTNADGVLKKIQVGQRYIIFN